MKVGQRVTDPTNVFITMKGSKEHKRYISILRKIVGKRNGVISSFAMDDMKLFKLETCKKAYRRRERTND